MYPQQMTQMHRGVLAKIFTAVSITLTKMWKQPKCPNSRKCVK